MDKVILTLVISMVTFSIPASGDNEHHQKRGPLIVIMKELGMAMNQVNSAIFSEDFPNIKKSAEAIAHHPHVLPSELKTISQALGADMNKFKQWDIKVHEEATALALVARKKDMKAIIEKQHTIMQGCVGCHNDFRIRVREAIERSTRP